ncbi:M14 family zinc carboxypeptidase [Amycolatopsis cihanbeyliensis]|uniref:Zinc carboxypeptidase n=1 Tax=Amycolatopsis cihanbeyliensis TaxID=1128664 RepID=A0A542DR48_AMYCI|nr:M14 family zinc carboxypeptidase [Amycolatopsis cihanbeyliensis]TQJ05573.1 zinc carboxypeptidase [Amycolatopsis cihanbeyliensis]
MGKTRFVSVSSALSAFLVLAALLAAPAQAAPTSEQGGHGRVDPRPSTAKLAFELQRLRLFSRGAVEVSPIGRSNEGRPVWSARVGHGPLRILYLTQQHGNEPLGTPAALEFLREAGLGHSPYQRWLRSRVTVDIVVRANPDGHERDWRYNYAPEADPEFGEQGKGYDINRYHNPELAPEDNPATEAGLIQRHYAEFRPDIVVDYHMQGRYRDDEGKEITGSVKWPTHPEADPAAVSLSKQVTVVAAESMNAAGGNISQYPGGNYQGIARNAYGLRGSGSVLVELSAMPAEHEQAQIRRATFAMLAIARGTANGSLRKIDPAAAEKIPPRGDPIGRATRADSA